jgi:hypothetical protein
MDGSGASYVLHISMHGMQSGKFSLLCVVCYIENIYKQPYGYTDLKNSYLLRGVDPSYGGTTAHVL